MSMATGIKESYSFVAALCRQSHKCDPYLYSAQTLQVEDQDGLGLYNWVRSCRYLQNLLGGLQVQNFENLFDSVFECQSK